MLNMCNINDNHMMYGSWDTECNRPNFLLFWTIFCPFTPLTAQKIKILQKWKKKKNSGDIISLQKCNRNHDHILHCSWNMVHDRCNCYFSFWAIFCLFTPLTAQKIKTLKKWKKNTWRYHHFKYVYRELWSDDVWFLRYGAQYMDGQTDGKGDI